MAANMYRVGDYVFFETSSTSPYQIRRIEELNKTSNGNVEAKVMCFYRRRDISSSLIMLADKHQCALEEDQEGENSDGSDSSASIERHQLKHRELFLSRQVETLPATHIRGKCSVTLLNETESLLSYLLKEDSFFYSLVYDPQQKTLLADKGEIRVGSRYQADIMPLLREDEEDLRQSEDLESLVWTPEHSLSDKQIDQFLVVSRSVGTFARALDCSSSVKQPSLHMSAAAASRDITLFHAMDILHKQRYCLSAALSSLVPSSGPVLCRDEMEEWSASEANLFEEALEKYGKDFNDIRQDFLPWKSLKNLVEYYYMWKTTDRYVQQKRVKAVEAESKLKQVYIPNYNKPNPAALTNGKTGLVNGNVEGAVNGKACESCNITSSSQWYAWGPSHMQCRLCHTCWMYWKKYGGLKSPSRLSGEDGDRPPSVGEDRERMMMIHGSGHKPYRCGVPSCSKEFRLKAHLARHCANAHGITIRGSSPRPIVKTRPAFFLRTTIVSRISRHLCDSIVRLRHASRCPLFSINVAAVKQACQEALGDRSVDELRGMLRYMKRERGRVEDISIKLGQVVVERPDWMVPVSSLDHPPPKRIAYPKPPKAPDGSLIYTPPESTITLNNTMAPSLLKKRGYEETNGIDGPPSKRMKDICPSTSPATKDRVEMYPSPPVASVLPVPPVTKVMMNHLNGGGRAKIAMLSRLGGRSKVISWMDAPDDVFFQATDATKKLRRQMTVHELRKAARKPWRKLPVSITIKDSVTVKDVYRDSLMKDPVLGTVMKEPIRDATVMKEISADAVVKEQPPSMRESLMAMD